MPTMTILVRLRGLAGWSELTGRQYRRVLFNETPIIKFRKQVVSFIIVNDIYNDDKADSFDFNDAKADKLVYKDD